jgi:hypothetical protein
VSLGGLLLLLGVSLLVAVQARWRGYPLVVWLIAGVVGNPIFILVLLAFMPDFARRRQRRQELDDLARRLEGGRRPRPAAAGPAPPAAGPSLGDASAHLPERSLGDEPTRL